jgi:PPOX class probable F420-dependent enzyme
MSSGTSRRDQIKMSGDEVQAFLEEQRTMSIATIGRDGRPHVVAMWYAFLDGVPSFWTFAKSQKVANLRRDARITCMVEAGDTYDQLRGVELVARAEIIDDVAEVQRFGVAEFERYQNMKVTQALMPQVQRMANKRVVVKIHTERIVSWDHRKLGGTY